MQETHDNGRSGVDLIRRDSPVATRAYGEPARPVALWSMFLLLVILAVGIFLAANTQRFLTNLGLTVQNENADTAKIRRYNEKLERIQERMSAFIAESVEGRLRALESNVSAGTVGADEIRTAQELRNELRLLEDYSAGKGGDLTDSSRLEHARFQATPGSASASAMTAEILGEAVRIKHLLYLSIASCGLIGLMVSGYWWQQNARIRRLTMSPEASRLLPRHPASSCD
jgi:hypothetical protein